MSETTKYSVVDGPFTFARANRGTGNGRNHDWNTLCDGQIRQVTKEDMGKASLRTFKALLWRAAKSRGMKVRTAIHPDTGNLVVQSYKPAPGETNDAPEGAKDEAVTDDKSPETGATENGAAAAESASENGSGEETPAGEDTGAKGKGKKGKRRHETAAE
jgi:hypothetical protein